MPQDVFATLPYEIILLIVKHIPVLDYYNVKLACSPRLSYAIRAAQSRLSKVEYFDHLTREDALRRGLSKGIRRKPMEILIERGSWALMLAYRDKYEDNPRKLYYRHKKYDADLSVNVIAQEKECFSLALHWAAGYNQELVALPLLDRVNLRAGKLRRTALHYAAENNHVDMARELLRSGAYTNALDNFGITPLGVAMQHDAHGVANLLNARGALEGWVEVMLNEEWARPFVDCQNKNDISTSFSVLRTYLPQGLLRGCPQLTKLMKYYAMKREKLPEAKITQVQKDLAKYAIERDELPLLRLMLDEGLDPNSRVSGARRALHSAANKNRIALTKLLLDRGANPYLTDHNPESDHPAICPKTPFYYAISRQHKELVDLYRSRGCCVNWRNENGQTALWIATRSSAPLFGTSVVKYLIDLGADVNIPDREGATPLLKACMSPVRHQNVLTTLVEAGADVNLANEDGMTPLLLVMLSTTNVNVSPVVKLLLEHGARVDIHDLNGRGPLHLARMNFAGAYAAESVALVLDHGANINHQDHRGRTPLHYAVVFPKIVDSLIDRGAEVNARDDLGNTPLHMVCKSIELENGDRIFSRLLEAGADLDQRNNQGDSPLHSALDLSTPSIQRCLALVMHGSDTRATGSRGLAPLSLVVEQEFMDIATKCVLCIVLLKHGATVDTRGTAGATPLLYLLQSHELSWDAVCSKMMVLLFLAHGASVHAADDLGRCPLDLMQAAGEPLMTLLEGSDEQRAWLEEGIERMLMGFGG
ncbi:ankyrin repeat-containing domain protein [Aspergillus pseudoustus]|uniref:Ankyrin repeat-containing domain protein n=1 Tax=Aspergillus pseudoustus TaxID=1810923 RepID=A0ABR4IY40_9EURO